MYKLNQMVNDILKTNLQSTKTFSHYTKIITNIFVNWFRKTFAVYLYLPQNSCFKTFNFNFRI